MEEACQLGACQGWSVTLVWDHESRKWAESNDPIMWGIGRSVDIS